MTEHQNSTQPTPGRIQPERDRLDTHTRDATDRVRARRLWWHELKRTAATTAVLWFTIAAAVWLAGGTGRVVGALVHPLAAVLAGAVLVTSGWVVHVFRHRHDRDRVTLPEYLPPRCTFFDWSFYIGSGYTEAGHQPGDLLEPEDELLASPHAAIEGTGVFLHTMVEGGTGSGKSSGAITKAVADAVRKFPMPPPAPRDSEGGYIALPAYGTPEHVAAHALQLEPACWRQRLALRRTIRRLGGIERIHAMRNPQLIAAYGGCVDEPAAERRRAELIELHQFKRPAIFVVNAKQESRDDHILTLVRAVAMADSPERLAQVTVVSPTLGTSIAAFDLERTNADLGDSIVDAIDILDEKGDPYYAQTAAQWLTMMVAVLRVTRPGRVSWQEIIAMCQSQAYTLEVLAEAERLLEDQEEALRDGRPLDRAQLDPTTLEQLTGAARVKEEDWRKHLQRVLNLARYLQDGDLARVMAPEVPTYGTWDDVLREGRIVVLDMPVQRYGSVARAITILHLTALVSAASRVGGAADPARRRPLIIVIDELSLFVNKMLAEATALVRAADVGFIFGFQTAAQLDEGGRAAQETLRTNCANLISFRDPDGAGAEVKSGMHGMKRAAVRSVTIGENLTNLQDPLGGTGSASAVHRSAGERIAMDDVPRFRAEIIQHLPMRHAIARLANGPQVFPSRRIVTPRMQDVPWHADALRCVPPALEIPIPIMTIAGDPGADLIPIDRLHYLVNFYDSTREDLLGLTVLRDAEGTRVGLLIWNHRFGWRIREEALVAVGEVLAAAFAGGAKVMSRQMNPPPPLILRSLQAGQELRTMLGIELPRPVPLAEAIEHFKRDDRSSALEAPPMPDAWDAFGPAPIAQWLTQSRALRRFVEAGRDVLRGIQDEGREVWIEQQDEWSDALGGATSALSIPTRARGVRGRWNPAPGSGTRTKAERNGETSERTASAQQVLAFLEAGATQGEKRHGPRDRSPQPAATPASPVDEGGVAVVEPAGLDRERSPLGGVVDAAPSAADDPTTRRPHPRPGPRARVDDGDDLPV